MNTFVIMESPSGSILYLEGIVKGLVSESLKVKKRSRDLDFDIGCLPISIEDLRSMISLGDLENLDIEMSIPEMAYANNLERFGQVRIPPPSYAVMIHECKRQGKPVEAIDMDDEHYTMAYCKHVSGTNWIMQSFRDKRLLKKNIPGEDPVEFALSWDKEVNKLSGYRELERHREVVMAKNIYRLSKKGAVYAIVEVERFSGIVDTLKKMNYIHQRDKD